MKVNSIQNQNLSFTAGKVKLYSDFDGTYFPESQSNLYDIKPERVEELNSHFKDFNTFFENTKGDLTFKITTGRTFGEYKNISEIIKSKGIMMPYPESFIAKNGSDEYITTNNFGFYSKNFPFDYEKINIEKQQNIENLTGWTKDLKNKLKEILDRFHFEIIEHDSENPPKDHGESSLFSKVGYDNFELREDIEPKSDWKVGLRRDGNLKLSISFPYDMLHVKERKEAYAQIKSEFEKLLIKNNIKFVSKKFVDRIGGNRPTIDIVPKIKNKPLTKLYDTKQAVKNAIINNDLVITAGDGMNDFEMLNPLNYIKGEKNLSNPETIKELKKLPFIGIVIKGENTRLKELVKDFKELGKIIEIEKGQLKEGIIKAIKQYASSNPEFESNMTNSFKFELGIDKPKIKTAIKKSNNKIFAIVTGLTAGISGILFALKNKKSNEVQNENR